MGESLPHGPQAVLSQLRQHDIPRCIDIVRRSFDAFQSDADAVANWFDARIVHNPWQSMLPCIGVGASIGGELVAFRAMSAQPWWIHQQPRVIAFAAHTCVDPEHRGSGLGSKLIAASMHCADITGSTSAGDITQRVYRKLGFAAIGGAGNDFHRGRISFAGSLQTRFGDTVGRAIGSAVDLLRRGPERRMRIAAWLTLEPVTRCDAAFDALWELARPSYAACLDRSSRYLNWRLFDHPTHPLSMLALRNQQRQVLGYVVWHALAYSAKVRCVVVRDLFAVQGDDDALLAMLALATRHWRLHGFTWLNLEVASPHLCRLFAALGYTHLPSNGNRYQVYQAHGRSLEAVDGWLRSGLDGDYFDTRPSGSPT